MIVIFLLIYSRGTNTGMTKQKVIIQGLWIGSRLSRFEYNSIKSYLVAGYEYHLYTYDKVDNIPENVIIKEL